jgi:hypothetical protein
MDWVGRFEVVNFLDTLMIGIELSMCIIKLIWVEDF